MRSLVPFLLFFSLVTVEVVVTISITSLLGFWLTLTLIAFKVVLGAVIVHLNVGKIWQQLKEGRSMIDLIDTLLVCFGGVFFIIPGLFSAILGIFCLLKPTRRFLYPITVSQVNKPNIGFNKIGTIFFGGSPFGAGAGSPFGGASSTGPFANAGGVMGGKRVVVDGKTGEETFISADEYIDGEEPIKKIDVEVLDISRNDD